MTPARIVNDGIQARPVSAPPNDSSHSGKRTRVRIIAFAVGLLCLGSCAALILVSGLAQPCGPLDEMKGKASGCLQAIDPGGRGQAIHLSFSPKRSTLNILQYDGASIDRSALGRLAVFDLQNGRIARTVDLPSGESSPFGEFIDGEVRYGDTFWNIDTGERSGVYPHPSRLNTEGEFGGERLLPGRRILDWNTAGAAVILDRDSGDLLQRVRDGGPPYSIDYTLSEDGSTLAVGGCEAIEFINLSAAQRSPAPLTYSSSLDITTDVTLSRDGKFYALACGDGYSRTQKIAVLESATGREIATFGVPAGKLQLALSPDGSILCVASDDKQLHVFSVELKRKLLQLGWGRRPFDNTSYVQASAFSPDGRYFALAWGDGLPSLFDVSRWRGSAGIPAVTQANPTVTPWPPRTRGPSPTRAPTVIPTVTPNPTIVSQAAQVRLAAAKQWPLVFSDTFDSNANRWPLRENNIFIPATAVIHGGVYRWSAHPDDYSFLWEPPEKRIEKADVYVAIDARRVTGPTKDMYGLVIRERAAHDGFFGFRINDNGEFEYDVLTPRAFFVSQSDLTPSSAIRPGKVNRLAVLAQGEHISLFINDEFVSVVDEPHLASGGIGVTFDIEKDTDNVFEFDNLEVRAP